MNEGTSQDTHRLRHRFFQLRNYQSKDFWAMIFARPLTILLLLPICNTSWVTPNRITTLSIMTKLSGVALLVLKQTYWADLLAAVLLNLGLVLDNMDGTLARYRNSSSLFGFYYDKASDAVTFVLIFWAMAFKAYSVSFELIDLFLPLSGLCGVLIAAYVKWVADRVAIDQKLKHLANDQGALSAWIASITNHDQSHLPPRRTIGDWARFFGWALLSILLFNEVDIFFWIALALITARYWIFTRIICFFLSLGVIVVPIIFAVKVARLERLHR